MTEKKEEKEEAGPGWVQSLVMKVVDNLQVFIDRVRLAVFLHCLS